MCLARRRLPVAQVHAWHAGLQLPGRGIAQQETCQCGSGAVIGRRLGGETRRELVVPTTLDQCPHGPDHLPVVSSKLVAVAALLPRECFAAFEGGVPLVHRRGLPGVAERGVTLDVEIRRAPWGGSPAVGPG